MHPCSKWEDMTDEFGEEGLCWSSAEGVLHIFFLSLKKESLIHEEINSTFEKYAYKNTLTWNKISNHICDLKMLFYLIWGCLMSHYIEITWSDHMIMISWYSMISCIRHFCSCSKLILANFKYDFFKHVIRRPLSHHTFKNLISGLLLFWFVFLFFLFFT